MRSWYTIRALAESAEVAIYDEIGAFGVSAKAFLDELGGLPDEQRITLRINSPGGSVFDAVAIHNALKRHPAGVTVWIDGIAASAASYIAMAGDEVVMPANAFLMIHDPSGMVLGTAGDMRAMAEALDKIKTSLVAGYAAKSGGTDADIAELMRRETWFDAEEAVALGFVDRVAEPVRIAARFDVGRFRNAPPELVEEVGQVEAIEASDDDGAAASDEEDGDTARAKAETEPESAAAPTEPDPPMPSPHPSAAAIRSEAMAQARAVVDLCTLAGLPQMASRFLADGVPIDEVRAALLAARADAGVEIDAHHTQPGRTVGARPWGEVIASTFKPKG
ncbi:head maturation protease, ClpP-related [Acuticoccus sp. I52.16.1]|uniref:head maturation protease, ClpP-related n=1 Tax=Acuticoccus sp. I52.16.1 TaxID=2928472 RepID=UPI001FD01FFC|nr:head maturation protease, ClpP-related [Acuticoccus sp. I52.16.1]UOM36647.1 ATP-dependent Clp protease proteolytic subunit [Acuticoccus sp. I52.16.1]